MFMFLKAHFLGKFCCFLLFSVQVGLMMVLLRFENGPMPKADPYHNHPHEQITYVIKGKLNFMIEGISHPLQAGDTISIASGLEHTIQTLSETVELIDCFSPIREDFIPKI